MADVWPLPYRLLPYLPISDERRSARTPWSAIRGGENGGAALPQYRGAARASGPLPGHRAEARNRSRPLEATLIDRRINVLARQEVTAGRQGESHVLHKALGAFPKDEAARNTWNGAAHSLVIYRLRHNVRDRENPIGCPPRSARGRAEHARVQKQLEAGQRRLGRTQQHSAQRTAAKVVGIGL